MIEQEKANEAKRARQDAFEKTEQEKKER